MKIHLPAPLKTACVVLLSITLTGLQLSNRAIARPLFASDYQQSIVVSGTVTSATNNEGLPGVNIIVKGTSMGTVTDVNGQYKIEVPSRDAILVFTSIGYDTQEITVGDKGSININLAESTTSLDEIVVVGYGTQKKLSVTSSVADIKGDEILQRPVNSLQQSLQGKMPGLTVLDRGGAPGSSNAQIVVRGINKLYNPAGQDPNTTSQIGDNGPLVIVDGIEQPYQYINPNDIESVTVLKDASSSAIYGSRGGNGVILITTKRAKEGKVQTSYSGFYSVQRSLTQPKPMDIESYLRLQNTARLNMGVAPNNAAIYTEDYIQRYVAGSVTDPLKYPLPYNWYDVMLKDAPQINNTISVAGGTDRIKSRLSVRHQDQKGVIANTDSKLTDVRLTNDIKITDKFTIGADLNYRYQNSVEPHDINSIFRFFMQNAIWAVPQYPNGDYGRGTQGNNPKALSEIGGLNRKANDYFFGQLKGDWEIVKGLKATSQVGVRVSSFYGKDFTATFTERDSTQSRVINPNNTLKESREIDREVTWNNLLNYEWNNTNHSFRAMLGYAQIYHFNSGITAQRQNFYNNDIQALDQGANDGTKTNSGSDFVWGLRSYFGRLNYSFKDKYLLEANLRFDGSSRFDKGNKYASFPSFSAGYRISQESFMENVRNVISDLKFRGSWGVTGNNGVQPYSYIATMGAASYSFGGVTAPAYIQRVIPDPNLTWEQTTQVDIGVDAEFFNGRLNFTVDYYDKSTTGLLLSLPIPGVIGLTGGPTNAGEVENKGLEVLVGTQNRIGNFTLNGNVNFTVNNNKVISLVGNQYIFGNDIDPRYIQGEGYPVNAFWGYQTAGLYQSDAEAAADPTFMRVAKAGDVKMVDRNNDGKIDPSDMTYLGNSFPKYMFGANINAGYKMFQLNIFMQGTADVKMRIARALGEQGNYEGFTPDIYTDNYWTPERTDARFARPTKQDLRNQASTDRMLVDASYLRVKNVQLVFNVPKTFIEKVRLSNASVYVSATNLLTFSKLNEWNLDPESTSGWQNYYPQTRMYTVGLNLQF